MYTSGCFAIALGWLCYSGTPNGTTITCSDAPLLGTFTCKEFNAIVDAQMEAAKRSGCASADGSSSTCLWAMPRPPARRGR